MSEFARAEAEATMLRAIAEGMKRTRQGGAQVRSREVVALRLVEALESLARQSQQLVPAPISLLTTLGGIRQQLATGDGPPATRAVMPPGQEHDIS
jgi:hypothetical protein